jgi:hypothetical protein
MDPQRKVITIDTPLRGGESRGKRVSKYSQRPYWRIGSDLERKTDDTSEEQKQKAK